MTERTTAGTGATKWDVVSCVYFVKNISVPRPPVLES